MTYRDRREAKAERLREWAAKREAKAEAVFEHNRPMTSDWAFITQPGHIPARARIIAQEDRQFESLATARRMESRADGIESQLAGSIYSDDPDAVDRLRERIAGLEGERDRVKAYNASCRKGTPDLSTLDDSQRQLVARLTGMRGCGLKDNGAFPSYHLSNLSGNIKRNRDRLAELEGGQS